MSDFHTTDLIDTLRDILIHNYFFENGIDENITSDYDLIHVLTCLLIQTYRKIGWGDDLIEIRQHLAKAEGVKIWEHDSQGDLHSLSSYFIQELLWYTQGERDTWGDEVSA